jgi:methionyl-tRNA formyltransferase
MKTRIVVVGNGAFAAKCMRVMADVDGVELSYILADPHAMAMPTFVEQFARTHRVPLMWTPNINAPDVLAAVEACEPDFLFSAYNMQILGRRLLRIPRRGCVNFHNGPLPRYRGVNTYSWAIIQGEREFGVTWHAMGIGIDQGDVWGQKMFPLDGTETPWTLAQKGFQAGVELLREILVPLLHNELSARPQDEQAATYYRRTDVPNGGRIDFAWPFEHVERFIRGLSFYPLPNPFVYAQTSFRGHVFYPQKVTLVRAAKSIHPGQIAAVDEDGLDVQVGDAVVRLQCLLRQDGTLVAPRDLANEINLRAGDILE